MPNGRSLSRRRFLSILCIGAGTSAAGEDASADPVEHREILEIARRLADLRCAFARKPADDALELIERMTSLRVELAATRATSVKGVQVKARETAWATAHEHGGFDPADELSTNSKLAASIVRDLLDMHSASRA